MVPSEILFTPRSFWKTQLLQKFFNIAPKQIAVKLNIELFFFFSFFPRSSVTGIQGQTMEL